MTTHTAEDLRQMVEETVRKYIDIANAHFNKTFEIPKIEYCRGRAAGWAYYNKWLIKINAVLLVENTQRILERTVPHEVAHLVTGKMYPGTIGTPFKKGSPHGREWKSVMTAFGCETSRCHNMDTTNSSSRRTTKHLWVCDVCGTEMRLGPKQHKKMLRNVQLYRALKKGCSFSHTSVTYKGEVMRLPARPTGLETPRMQKHEVLRMAAQVEIGSNIVRPRKQKAAPKPSVMIPLGTFKTKYDHCRHIFMTHKGVSRKEMINMFIVEADCTPAGASTYYQKIQKEQ